MVARKIVAIIGPTASGKSELAIKLAHHYSGEIVCADSRSVYKGMDIGTAKPSRKDQAMVRHHLLDIVEPTEKFTVADFKLLAEQAIEDIFDRNKVPIVTGGSGLYLNVLLYDYQLLPPSDEAFRRQLEGLPTPELVRKLAESDPEAAAAIDTKNRRRVIRAIETAGLPKVRLSALRPDTMLVGLKVDPATLKRRVSERAQSMIDQGLVDEVKQLGECYGWESEAMSGVAYRAFKAATLGRQTIEEAKSQLVNGDMSLAKKQMTWFKRDSNIHWVSSTDQAEALVDRFLG